MLSSNSGGKRAHALAKEVSVAPIGGNVIIEATYSWY
jgi:hypothetical protein